MTVMLVYVRLEVLVIKSGVFSSPTDAEGATHDQDALSHV